MKIELHTLAYLSTNIWTARSEDFPIVGSGKTPEEATTNMRKAVRALLQDEEVVSSSTASQLKQFHQFISDKKDSKGADVESLQLRKVEKFFVDGEAQHNAQPYSRVTGYWSESTFAELVKGDIYRLWEETGEPVQEVDGHHDMSVALSDAKPCDPPGNWVVQSLSLNSFNP